jgi:hypothetical protein
MTVRAGYKERVRVQAFQWAMGKPYHNRIDDECCPDFSCCHPDLFERDASKRWESYRRSLGEDIGGSKDGPEQTGSGK